MNIKIFIFLSLSFAKITYGQLKVSELSTGLLTGNFIVQDINLSELNDQVLFKKAVKSSYLLIANLVNTKLLRNKKYHIVLGYGNYSKKYVLFNKVKQNYVQHNVVLGVEKKMEYYPNSTKKLKLFAVLGGVVNTSIRNQNLAIYTGSKKILIYPAFYISLLHLEHKVYNNYNIKAAIGYGYKGVLNMGISRKF